MMQYRTGGASLIIPGVEVWQAGGGGDTPFAGAYDNVPNLAALLSTRRALTSWTGNLCRLLRNSDDATLDFGYVANGDLDTAAIASWLGGSSGFWHTVYDQTGNGKHAVQTTKANMPLYVASGQNGKPVKRFDGTNDRMVALNALGVSTLSNASMLGVYKTSDADPSDRMYGFGAFAVDSSSAKIHLNPATEASLRFDGGFIAGTLSHPTLFFVRSTLKSGTTYHDYFNGVVNINGSTLADGGIVDDLYMGHLNLATGGDIAELVIANAAWGTSDRQAAEAAANAYWAIY